jgi:hypothetical protein
VVHFDGLVVGVETGEFEVSGLDVFFELLDFGCHRSGIFRYGS